MAEDPGLQFIATGGPPSGAGDMPEATGHGQRGKGMHQEEGCVLR